MLRPRADLSVYVVLDAALCAPPGLVEIARAAARGGAGLVQLRDKQGDTRARTEAARAIKAALAGTGALLVVNDDAEAAVAADADGLHVGQGDMGPAAARALIGPGRLLGLSVETAAQAARVDAGLVDHAGVGPVFATATKPDHAAPLGLDGLAAAVAACPVPAVAIGGLGAAHAAAVLAAGAAGLAVASAVCAAPDPEAATRAIADAVREARR
jgi:thiamine-phosphate pyrophosphorylase